MTDYLGSQAWRDELMDLLRTNATPPFAAVIAGKDQGMTDEEIAEQWRALGGLGGRGPGGACTVKNVRMWWIDVQNALTARVPTKPRRAHDIAAALKQALQSPAAGQQFLQDGGAYYRRLYVVNPTKIPADWRDW
jgi:hypothetical protein